MAQYIYTMIGVSKIVPPNRTIIKDISLSFFPGAKIGLLGLNGAAGPGLLGIAIAHGLILSIAVTATMNVSGGHINPAVTVAMRLK